MSRAQSIVHRNGKVLMVEHHEGERRFWCLPGGAMLEGESPADGAVRELEEECRVKGTVVRLISEVHYGPDDTHFTYHLEIGEQEPLLGHDPEHASDKQILKGVAWKSLDELNVEDRAFLFGAGILALKEFEKQVRGWGKNL